MLADAKRDFGSYPEILDFIFSEGMKNNAHVCSRVVLSRSEGFDGLIAEIQSDIKASFGKIKKAPSLTGKCKLKLWLIGYAFPLYRAVLRLIKPPRKEV